jgi:hypothetical protein
VNSVWLAANLGSRASYRHSDRGPLSMNLGENVPIKTLSGGVTGT